MSSRIALGVVGLGSDWTDSIGARIAANPRIRLAALYDFSYLRTQQIARECSLRPCGSASRIVTHPGVRALVCCSLGWRPGLVDCFLESGKPVFLSEKALESLPQDLGPLLGRVEETGAIVCPDLSWRYTPATLRLRELMAVHLGPAVEIRISLPDSQPKLLPAMLDWCRIVTGGRTCPVPHRSGTALHLDLDRAVARITSHHAEGEALDPALAGVPNWIVQCERGVAILRGEHQIEWSTGEEARVESLEEERSRLDVNLDLFFRRVVGGLVPAPTLLDVKLAREAAASVSLA